MDALKAASRLGLRSLPSRQAVEPWAQPACAAGRSQHAWGDRCFRRAGRQRSYRNVVMVTTLAPCWYCSGLVRQFRIGTVIVGESRTFAGGLDWLRENGIEVIDLDNRECRELLEGYIAEHPEIWNEDIGEE